ncbi:serine protease [Pseudomonas sp. Irchel s3h17]|uniref:trypsin-like serine peptidase n=1 Tax=Pseudomonas sp. Irchel s3h17 TaxID=2009182 RepID=UPI000BA2F74D|nr:trypsin-like peptidase domain-containing protein [Pseudomonas sp. Irchel s3h17]
MKYLSFLCFAGLMGLLAISAVQARDLGEGAVNDSPSRALQNSEHFYEIWSGVGRLSLQSGETCSAVLLDTRNRQGQATGPAYLLTSGHCVLFQYGSARTHLPLKASVTFHYFHDTPQRKRRYAIRTARWSSLVGTDLAVLEVDATLASLIQAGVNPLKLASHQSYESHDVLNIGAPVGFAEQGLRLSACAEQTAGTFIDYPGVFPLAMRNRCDLRAGSSGSPMLNRGTNEITGIVSKVITSRMDPSSPGCENSTSCEAARFNYSYSANFLHSCFIDGVFTSNGPDCSLEPVDLIVTAPWSFQSYVHRSQREDGQIVLPTWEFGFSLETPFYRYKAVRNARDCKIPDNYSAAIDTTDAYINTEIGPANGAWSLCIIGVENRQQNLTRATLNNVFMQGVYLSATLGNVEAIATDSAP